MIANIVKNDANNHGKMNRKEATYYLKQDIQGVSDYLYKEVTYLY